MLQNLLADRFKLATHHENREMAQFDLVVAKGGPKFKKAGDPVPPAESADEGRPKTPQGLTLDKSGYPVFQPGRAGMAMVGDAGMYQPRMAMSRLAGQIGSQLRTPVNDATGLAGEYEISLYWMPDSGLRAAPATEPEAGPTLVDAIRDQLGLRLESKKGQADFLVVDHAEKLPVEN